MKRNALSVLTLACIVLTPAAAFAHAGSDHWAHHHFAAGFAHPFTGLDHILAIAAVGMWAAQLGGRARWLVPLSFLTLMTAGGLVAGARVPLPYVESTLLASVLVTGLLLLFSLRLSPSAAVTLAGIFAIFHGYAHVAEMPPSTSPFTYFAGFLAGSAFLLALGFSAGETLTATRHRRALRLCGAAIAAATFVVAMA